MDVVLPWVLIVGGSLWAVTMLIGLGLLLIDVVRLVRGGEATGPTIAGGEDSEEILPEEPQNSRM